MLSVACASESPFASVSTHAKSFDSRTTVENDVRTSAAAASSTIEMSRVHSISSVTALKRFLGVFVAKVALTLSRPLARKQACGLSPLPQGEGGLYQSAL